MVSGVHRRRARQAQRGKELAKAGSQIRGALGPFKALGAVKSKWGPPRSKRGGVWRGGTKWLSAGGGEGQAAARKMAITMKAATTTKAVTSPAGGWGMARAGARAGARDGARDGDGDGTEDAGGTSCALAMAYCPWA